jgi:hypothetical protein
MEILIRSRFESVETAETCVKRIREAHLRVKEITLLPPKHLREDRASAEDILPIMNNIYPGTVRYGSGLFGMFAGDGTHREKDTESDVFSSDATVEIVADTFDADKIRSIIINSGGRDTVVY